MNKVEKKIQNVYPYNDPQNYTRGTEYINCFYSSLFSFLISNDKEILPYIANNIFYYGYSPNQQDLRFKYGTQTILFQSLEKLNEEQGIQLIEERISSDKIINYIIEHINEDKMISVKVDMYELSYRPDRYKKIHTPHAFIIYGYNQIKKKFYILDNPENSDYREMECSYTDLQNAYKILYETTTDPISYVWEKKELKNEYFDMTDYRKIFIKNLCSCRTLIFDKLECLKELKKEVNFILSSESEKRKKGMELFYLIHYQILNVRRAELYAYYRLLGSEKLIKAFKEIIQRWEKVRVNVYRCIENKEINLEKVDEICRDIGDIYFNEIYFYKKLYKSIESINLAKN